MYKYGFYLGIIVYIYNQYFSGDDKMIQMSFNTTVLIALLAIINQK